MKKHVKKAINTLGFELTRKPQFAQPPIASADTRNTILELIGPSGIGKSTLHAKMRNVLQYRWNMHYAPANELHQETNAQLDDFYRKCICMKASQLYEWEKNFTRNVSLLRFFTKGAEEDRYLKLSGLLHQGGWFLDEGFTHYFTPELIKIIETNAIEHKVLEQYFAGRRFVLLNAPTDYVVENLRERQSKKTGTPSDLLSIYSEDKVRRHIQKSLDNMRILLELSTAFGARFWGIEITGRNDDALNFIRSIEPDIIKTNDELDAKPKLTAHGRTL